MNIKRIFMFSALSLFIVSVPLAFLGTISRYDTKDKDKIQHIL